MADAVANAGSDQTIDLSSVSLPQNVNLTGSGTAGTGGTTISSYAWEIVDAPAGHGATLSSASAQNPTLNGVDTWGNYLLLLVVTDDAANVSDDNPYTAPNSALVKIKVQSAKRGLEKVAAGERDYKTAYHALVDAAENNKVDLDALEVNDLSDVAAATTTGPNLDNLMDDSYATQSGSAGGTRLHKHEGSHVDAATTSARGAIICAEAPADSANPKAVTQDRVPLTAFVDSVHVAGTVTQGKVGTNTAAGNEGTSNCHWYAHEAITVTELTVSMADSGTTAGGGYVFTFYKMTEAQFVADNFGAATSIGTVTIAAPSSDNDPGYARTTGLSVAVAARELIVVKATTAPGSTGAMGSRAQLTAWCRRLY